jgi:aminopeptidase N
MKGVLSESEGVIKFYEEQLYGPYIFGDLNIVQMYPNSGYAQAPPALVQLDGLSFLSQEQIAQFYQDANLIHEFLGHEIAHQWWGHTIGWSNDHDAWLSESFAEYSAGLYFLAYLGPNAFEQKLANWKKSTRLADPFGPIALASILSGDVAGPYRDELLYDKGPLVVHMIRTQLGDDNFKKAMKQVLTKYKGQNITTEMLANELAAVSGYSWDYFFNQWFRGVGIPEIHYKYSVTPAEGKYKFDITFTQKDKENFKRILALPVVWHGKGKDQTAQKSFVIKDPVQTYSLMLPFEPKSVEVDPNADVLADYVQDK